MAHVLWTRHLRFDPSDPSWPDRDRFVLSAGHGSMLLYALLHLSGYGLAVKELEAFRQWGSRTPGHPEYGLTPGVETTTGPLGAGFSNGVGMALAEAFLAATFNRPGYEIVDHRTFGCGIACASGDSFRQDSLNTLKISNFCLHIFKVRFGDSLDLSARLGAVVHQSEQPPNFFQREPEIA